MASTVKTTAIKRCGCPQKMSPKIAKKLKKNPLSFS